MSRKIMSGMLTAALWIAALSLVGAIVLDPAGEHDLLPALVAAAALLDGPAEGVIVGIAVGLFYDLGFIGIDGLYPLFFMLFGLVAGAMSRLTLSGSYVSMLLMTAFEMVALGLLRYFTYLLPQAGASFVLVLQQIVGGTLLACLFSFIVYLPMRKISRKFAER